MEAMSLVEVVLNQGHEDDNERTITPPSSVNSSSPIKLDESVTITVTRTPGRPNNIPRQSGKPANFALLSSPVRNGRNSDAIRLTPREEMICNGCERVFKYKAAFIRHEAQCGLPMALRIERAAIIEAKKAEKAAELVRRKMEERVERQEKMPELRCPTCLKQFYDNDSFKNHDFDACAEERATYTFVCGVCQARFKYKNHLRRHEDSHNNVRRYNCDVCTTAFLRPDHLKRHMMRMHGIVNLPAQSAPEKLKPKPSPELQAVVASDEKISLTIKKNAPMQCPMCSKVLSRRDHLLRHIRNVHHVNYDTKKRGRAFDPISSFDGGLMDQDRTNSYQDDDDDDESLTSDGLQIDESFESLKRESESPNPEDCDDSTARTDQLADYSQEKNFSKSQQLQLSHSNRKSSNHSLNQFDEGHCVKTEDCFSLKTEVQFPRNYVDTGVNSDEKSYAKTFTDQNSFGTTGKKNSQSLPNYGAGTMSRVSESEGKASNSDGNQNMLSNGNSTRNAGLDWVSDLSSISGW